MSLASKAPFLSFRDPEARFAVIGDKGYRFVNEKGEDSLGLYLKSKCVQALIAEKKLVGFSILSDEEKIGAGLLEEQAGGTVISHRLIYFPSFPSEWIPEMLHSAAELTLELFALLLEEGLGLKDATPMNVLFEGVCPQFVDLFSIEERAPRDPRWLAQWQFISSFLLPLYLNQHEKIPLKELFSSEDHVELGRCLYHKRWFNPTFLSLIYIPYHLGKTKKGQSSAIYQAKQLKNPDVARFILKRVHRSLKKHLKKLCPQKENSAWTGYMQSLDHYTISEFEKKESWVKEKIAQCIPKRMLDIGCNNGYFSKIGAQEGAQVVAIDQDVAVLSQVWEMAKRENLSILPLCVNICFPTPATGWKNQERPSFLQRAENKFDLVLMLAVYHHIIVTERVPPEELAALISNITTKHLIIEYVDHRDQKFREIVRGREELYQSMTRERFERAFSHHFETVNVCKQHTTRALFLMRKKV